MFNNENDDREFSLKLNKMTCQIFIGLHLASEVS